MTFNAHLTLQGGPPEDQRCMRTGAQLAALVALVAGVKYRPFSSNPFNNTMRACGSPSLSAVASVMTLASSRSLSIAALSHSEKGARGFGCIVVIEGVPGIVTTQVRNGAHERFPSSFERHHPVCLAVLFGVWRTLLKALHSVPGILSLRCQRWMYSA